MGLDTVELIMTVEETFDLTVPDAEAEKILTVGDLYRYVLSQLDGAERETPHCLTAATFYRLRRKLIGCCRVARRGVRPRSLMDTLIPEANRPLEWQRLGENLGWKLPELVRPDWVGWAYLGLLLSWLATVIFAWGQLSAFAPRAMIPNGIGFVVGAVVLADLVYRLTKPLALRLPRRCESVRGMVATALVLNLGAICNKDQAGWNRYDVWAALRTIIVLQMGVSPDEVTESANFVYDLGRD